MAPLFKNKIVHKWRDQIFIENYLGYLIHRGRYKYELDDKKDDKLREVFSDLQVDPDETNNMIYNPKYTGKIDQLRNQLLIHLAKNDSI